MFKCKELISLLANKRLVSLAYNINWNSYYMPLEVDVYCEELLLQQKTDCVLLPREWVFLLNFWQQS